MSWSNVAARSSGIHAGLLRLCWASVLFGRRLARASRTSAPCRDRHRHRWTGAAPRSSTSLESACGRDPGGAVRLLGDAEPHYREVTFDRRLNRRPRARVDCQGDYVQLMLNHPVAGPTAVSVTKYALRMPRDRRTVVETPSASVSSQTYGQYFSNGAALGTSLPVATDGKRLDHLRQGRIIPPGEVYVGSRHARGFDSRYFGLVPLTSLQRMRRLL
ncbi:hypothetical protein ABIC65_000228 [Sphingomonas trueperi]